VSDYWFRSPPEVDPQLDFTFANNGHIYCANGCGVSGPEIWCEHLQEALVKGWDWHAIWPEDHHPADQFQLMIPVFPKSNQWTEVVLTKWPRYDKIPRLIVEWDQGPVDATVFVCFNSPGEGRRTIRNTLVEMMWGDPARRTECHAAHHGFAAEMEWQEKMKNPNTTAAAQWAVYITGECLHCQINNFSNDPDLVPPKQGSVW
jgi:hypothetical protein